MFSYSFEACGDGVQWSMLLLLLSRFSHVWLCATPEMAAHQAPLSLGFSRQEHWSGLPFPSPMHESEKWKVKVKSLSHAWLLATPWTAAHQAPSSMGFSRQEYGVGCHCLLCLPSLSSHKCTEIKFWAFGMGTLTLRPWTTRELLT